MANIKTISLSGTETKADICGNNVWIRNDSAAVIFAAGTPGITPGEDGVISVPAGGSAPIFSANGTVYLLGTGSVQLIGNDYTENPFKSSAASGGSGADDVARAAIGSHEQNREVHVTAAERANWNSKAGIDDIPLSLPANGGRSDNTTYLSQFYLGVGIDILDYTLHNIPDMCSFCCGITNCPTCPTNYGYSGNDNDFYYQINRYTQAYANIHAFDVRTNNMFINTLIGGEWSGWKKVSDGGVANELMDLGGTALIKADYYGKPLTASDSVAAFDDSDPQNVRLSQLSLSALAGILPTVPSAVNASFLGTHPTGDFVLKSEFDSLAARVKALEEV